LFSFRPEFVAGAADEDIFQTWFADRDRFNFPGKALDYIGNESVAVHFLHANLPVEHLRVNVKALPHALRQGFGVVRRQ
jgi:hypothetical protein